MKRVYEITSTRGNLPSAAFLVSSRRKALKIVREYAAKNWLDPTDPRAVQWVKLRMNDLDVTGVTEFNVAKRNVTIYERGMF